MVLSVICGDENCYRRATVRLGIDTLIAYILVFWLRYFLFFLFSFFRPPILRRLWADFRKTLPHDVPCPEIVHLL